MSIATALTNLEAARAGIAAAVNGKGGTLADGATLWQAKAGVDAIQVGGGETNPMILTALPVYTADQALVTGNGNTYRKDTADLAYFGVSQSATGFLFPVLVSNTLDGAKMHRDDGYTYESEHSVVINGVTWCYVTPYGDSGGLSGIRSELYRTPHLTSTVLADAVAELVELIP